MSKARIQYRGKEVVVNPGHRAVLDCYKKKMLGQVVVAVDEDTEGGVVPEGEIDINSNGVQNVAGYATANVNVTPKLQQKTVAPTEQNQTVTADAEYDALSEVNVEAILTETVTVTGNGTVKPSEGKYLKEVVVSVPVVEKPTGTVVLSKNDTYDVTNFANAVVDVHPTLQEKSVVPTETEQRVTPDEGAEALSGVMVGAIPLETRTITLNGVHTASKGKYFKTLTVDVPPPDDYIERPVGTWDITENGVYNVLKYETANVNVQPALQEKSVTPTASAQEVVADSGVYGLKKVTVNAVPTEEVTIIEPVKEVAATPGRFISKVKVNVPTVTVRSGTSEPTNDIGSDGDIYLLLEG